ncbi:MAG: hypothetical protein ABSE36_15495 [Terracidiphilus sp.]|jgi:hypothetical protein
MNIKQFGAACAIDEQTQVDRACLLAFFYLRTEKKEEFTTADAAKWLFDYGYPNPNRTRLDDNLKASAKTIRGLRGYKLKLTYIAELDKQHPQLQEKSEEILDHGTILVEAEYKDTRSYIETLAKQINRSYEENIFDGCAVIMRRLLEVMLILAYKKLGSEAAIQDVDGNFKMLEGIINDAKTNSTLGLSRNSKELLEVFRKLGNFSAHKIEYTCHRQYIQPHIMDYRGIITELLYKAGLKT